MRAESVTDSICSLLSSTNSPSPHHHISLFSGGNVALQQNGSVGNLYNNPISAAEAQYMQQQQLSTTGRAGSANGAVVVMDGFGGGGGGISTRQTEEPPIVPNHHQQVRSLNRLKTPFSKLECRFLF